MNTFLIVLAVLMLVPGMLSMFNRWLPKPFCTIMGWHLEPEKKAHDGFSLTGTCPRCGKTTMRDSQGNWF